MRLGYRLQRSSSGLATARRNRRLFHISWGRLATIWLRRSRQVLVYDLPFCSYHLLGLRLRQLPDMDAIADQARALCREFVYHRLRKQGLLTLKVELQGAGRRTSDVVTELLSLASELERMYPQLYQNISRQLNTVMNSEHVVRATLHGVADAMFKSSVVTWGRVVALFSVASGLAAECVQQGHPEFVSCVVDSFGQAAQAHLATWIAKQGGWSDVTRAFRSSRETPTIWTLTGVGAIVGFAFTLAAIFNIS